MPLTQQQLVAGVEAMGLSVSDRQLERWRNRGILHRSTQHPLPQGGTVSIYPEPAVAQVAGILERRPRFGRDLDSMAVDLWWNDLWVSEVALRRGLKKGALALQTEMAIEWVAVDPAAAASDLALRAEAQSARTGGWGLVGQRLGREPARRHAALLEMLELAMGVRVVPAGGLLEMSVEQRDVLKMAGIDRALTDDLGANGPWLSNKSIDVAAEFSNGIQRIGASVVEVQTRLEAATMVELGVARDFLHWAADVVVPVVESIECKHGRDAGGLGGAGELLLPRTAAQTAWLVSLVLHGEEPIDVPPAPAAKVCLERLLTSAESPDVGACE